MEKPKILWEQTGLKIIKNLNNQFAVITLHHTADPNKRSPEWRAEAAAGMTTEQAARELDIDYTAVMGAKVFPEITLMRDGIVVPSPCPDFGPNVKYWGGFDYGLRNPSSFHVYTIVDGVTYAVFEVFHPCPNIPEFIEEMKRFPYWNCIRWIAADPNCWANTQQQSVGNPVSIQDLFWKNGVRNMIKGINNQEDTWINLLRQHWSNPEDPTFRIFDTCPNLIREFETAIFVNQSERQLMTTSFKEAINDKDNHALDDCKYFMLSQPKQRQETVVSDILSVNRWAIPANTKHSKPGFTPIKTDGRGYAIP